LSSNGIPSDLTNPDYFFLDNDYLDYPIAYKRIRNRSNRMHYHAFATTQTTPTQPQIQGTPTLGKPLSGRQNVNISIDGNTQPIEFIIDSGADYNIIKNDSSQLIGFGKGTPKRTQAITTASGQTTDVPVFDAKFSIEGQPQITAELLKHPQTPFNLLTTETLSQSFNATLNPAGGFDLIPKGGAAPTTPTSKPTTPTTTPSTPKPVTTTPVPPVTTTQPPFFPQIAKSGNFIIDAIRELYRILCAAKIPFVCNSPTHFVMSLLTFLLVFIIMAFKE
jgi:Aspartyl protease